MQAWRFRVLGVRGLEFRASGWFGCVCTFVGLGAALFVALSYPLVVFCGAAFVVENRRISW